MAVPAVCSSFEQNITAVLSSFHSGDTSWVSVVSSVQSVSCRRDGRKTTLFHRGAPVDENSRLREFLDVALLSATKMNSTEYVGLLLSRGANPNAPLAGQDFFLERPGVMGPEEIPLCICAKWKCGYVETAKLLLQHGATVDFRMLELCVRHEHFDLLRMLHAHGADVDTPGDAQDTVLHACARRGNVRAAALLVQELDADVNARTGCGDTVEDVARKCGQARFIEWLYMNDYVKVPAGSTAIAKRCYAFDSAMF